jgi:nucleoside phosphorylase
MTTNTYALGRMGGHDVVTACLPCDEYGMNAALKVALDMEKSFPAVKRHLVIGIGGGIPSQKHDIRLGDVVVRTRVIQHDMGKHTRPELHRTGITQRPAWALRTALSLIQSDPHSPEELLRNNVQDIVDLRPRAPDKDQDQLFAPSAQHVHGEPTCNSCQGPMVARVA